MAGNHILVVDDDTSHRNTLRTLLTEWGHQTETAADGETAVRLCHERPFDLVLMDIRMPGMGGIAALREIKSYNPSIPILIMTAYSDVDTAVQALKSGAYDYLTKPLDFDDLQSTIQESIVQANQPASAGPGQTDHPLGPGPAFVGASPVMRDLYGMISAVAPSDATVLILGESGTGKEVAARAVHSASPRRDGPFVPVNCAALSETLLESELFGHEKGAFTGADRRRDGRFQAAGGGTLFLDEIGEMPLPMQAKLLRAIQEREVQPVGGDKPVRVDVRLVAATNRDLAALVESGQFRQDLYYRLNVVTLRMPPLRERRLDIPLLAGHFLARFAEANRKRIRGFTPGAMDRLQKHSWPGNVRELENAIERAVVLLLGEYVSERELPPDIARVQAEDWTVPALAGMTLEEIENAAVKAVLEETGGNKSEAARRLGITRKTLQAKLHRLQEAGHDDDGTRP